MSSRTHKSATRTHLLRYALLIRKLRVGRASRDELIALVLEKQEEFLSSYSRTSLRRDFLDIGQLFGIDIVCDRSTNTYSIAPDSAAGADEQHQLLLLESWETQNLLSATSAVKQFVQLDTRRGSIGTEHLAPLLRAIKAQREVNFRHQKHWDDAPTSRRVWPVGLKEWAGRWYLLAFDQMRSGAFRIFGLDRMRELAETNVAFKAPPFDAADYFHDCFGVTRPTDAEPVELLLSFTWAQGRYVEDQPLHPSQTTLHRSLEDDEIRIQLRVFWTHEVLMALLTYGADVTVLAPARLRAELAAAHAGAVSAFID